MGMGVGRFPRTPPWLHLHGRLLHSLKILTLRRYPYNPSNTEIPHVLAAVSLPLREIFGASLDLDARC